MLVLSRGCDAVVHIGPDIQVKVLAIRKQRVKLGVDAPGDVRVWRDEVLPDPRPKVTEDRGEPPIAAAGRDMPILIVEDEPGHATLIRKVLAENDFAQCTVATSGTAALEILGIETPAAQDACLAREAITPFLILLDYHLPDRVGLEVLRRIRSFPRLQTTPVIVLSAEDGESVVSRCLEAGANAFVPKPATFVEFRKSVSRIVGFWSGHCRVPQSASVAT